jgi:acyl-CoA dehydrogenase
MREEGGMDFGLSEQQLAIRDSVSKICADFGEDYWLERDSDGQFPLEFVDAITAGGWLGIAMPEEFGGSGLGITEAAILSHAITRSGAGFSGASAVHLNLFGPHPIVVFGTQE